MKISAALGLFLMALSMASQARTTDGRTSTATGSNSSATNKSTAIGREAQADDRSVAVGNLSSAQKISIAVGNDAVAEDRSLAVGSNANATEMSTALGTNSFAREQSIAIGNQSEAHNTSVAIGTLATATGNNSAAIGYGSTATRDNTVSIGSAGNERTLSNVAPGVLNTDAANMGQVRQLERDLSKGVAAALALSTTLVPSAPGKVAVSLGGGQYNGQSAAGLNLVYAVPGWATHRGVIGGGVARAGSSPAASKVFAGFEF